MSEWLYHLATPWDGGKAILLPLQCNQDRCTPVMMEDRHKQNRPVLKLQIHEKLAERL